MIPYKFQVVCRPKLKLGPKYNQNADASARRPERPCPEAVVKKVYCCTEYTGQNLAQIRHTSAVDDILCCTTEYPVVVGKKRALRSQSVQSVYVSKARSSLE